MTSREQKQKAANRSSAARLRLRLTATAESIIRSGHPWLFADSIREQNRDGQLGELAVIYDRQDRFLAIGLFDPDSPIRLRILHAGKPETIDHAWWERRFRESVTRRSGLFDEQTTGYRLINGESDGWPGLVLDTYAGNLVLKIYTAAWLPRLPEIISIIQAQLPSQRVVLRLSRNIQPMAARLFQRSDGEIVSGDPLDGVVVFQESGLKFEADILRGQKTGFFLDQRENRRLVETLAADRDVLNAFSFSGGFSLYAARGGARSVTDVDISQHALASAERNFKLNHSMVAHCRHDSVQADVFEWIGQESRKEFDLIIVDPPSLAKREAERKRALEAYRQIAASAIRRLRSNGVLVAGSCSAHVSAQEFFQAVRNAAGLSGRTFQELRTTGHALDHPALFLEAEYLKAIYLRFTGKS